MVSITQTKIPVPESSEALFSQYLSCFSPFLELNAKNFLTFKETNWANSSKKKILVILKTTENRYLLEISDVQASTSSVWKTERGHTKSFVHRMYLFVKKPFASLLNCEYTGWMTVLSHSHLCLWVSPMGKFILNLSHHILFPGQQSDSRKIPTLLLFHLTWISRHQQISCESLGTTIWWLSLQACIQANVTEISTVIPANRCHSWQ